MNWRTERQGKHYNVVTDNGELVARVEGNNRESYRRAVHIAAGPLVTAAAKNLRKRIEDSRPTGDSVQEIARLEDWKRLRLLIIEEVNELARIVYRADN